MRSFCARGLPVTALLAAALMALVPVAAAAAPRAAVLPLSCSGAVPSAREEAVRTALRRTLSSAGHRVLPTTEVDRLLVIAQQRCISATCLAKNAKLLGVELLLGGRLELEAGGSQTWDLALWLYDASKGSTAAVHRSRCAACDPARLGPWATKTVRALLAQATDDAATTQLRVRSRPAGAAVTIDGAAAGITPMTFGIQPGRRSIEVQLAGYRASVQEVTVRAGATELVEVFLEPAGGRGKQGADRVRPASILKWVALGAGVAALAGGITLIALDGDETCDSGWGPAACPERQATLAPGIALTVTGGLATAISGLLFYYDARPEQPTRGKAVALVPAVFRGGGGLSAVARF
jgi:PEGA domain